MSSWPLLRSVVVSCEMTKEVILLPVLPLAVFLEARITLGGIVDEVEPGLVFRAQFINVKSMPGGPDVFLDIARIGEPFDGEFAFGERTFRGPGYIILVSPDFEKVGVSSLIPVAARHTKFTEGTKVGALTLLCARPWLAFGDFDSLPLFFSWLGEGPVVYKRFSVLYWYPSGSCRFPVVQVLAVSHASRLDLGH